MHKASNISSLDIRELASRKYLVAAIFGRFDPIRQQIFDHFRGTAGAYIYVSNYTGPPLSPQQIRAVYDQSVFVLCPPGALIQDTFRVYEALMAGAVPIVEDDPYWTELYGLEVPFVKVRKWSETIEKINQLASSPATLSRLRNHARIWWDLKVRYCEEIAKFCANLLM
jgi:hypothetical protein